jgi:hypothetical protein
MVAGLSARGVVVQKGRAIDYGPAFGGELSFLPRPLRTLLVCSSRSSKSCRWTEGERTLGKWIGSCTRC